MSWVLGVVGAYYIVFLLYTYCHIYSCIIVILDSNHITACVGRGEKSSFSLHVQYIEPFPFYFFSQTTFYFGIHFSLYPLFTHTHTHIIIQRTNKTEPILNINTYNNNTATTTTNHNSNKPSIMYQ